MSAFLTLNKFNKEELERKIWCSNLLFQMLIDFMFGIVRLYFLVKKQAMGGRSGATGRESKSSMLLKQLCKQG